MRAYYVRYDRGLVKGELRDGQLLSSLPQLGVKLDALEERGDWASMVLACVQSTDDQVLLNAVEDVPDLIALVLRTA